MLAVAVSVGFISSAHAVEGTWQPAQLPGIATTLQQHGLKLDPATLADLTAYPVGAIVSLGGCTASFVSRRQTLRAIPAISSATGYASRVVCSRWIGASIPRLTNSSWSMASHVMWLYRRHSDCRRWMPDWEARKPKRS